MAKSRLKDEKMPTEGLNLSLLSSIVFSCIQEDKLCKLWADMKKYEKSKRHVIVSQTINGKAPLFIACQQGKVHFVNYLLDECNADIEQRGIFEVEEDNSQHKVTPLWCAAVADKLDVVKTLVEHGAKINSSSDTGSTPVRSACYMTNVLVIKYLVENGADIHKPNINGGTCLINAVQNVDLCSFLINKGADVNAQDNSKNTALHYAIRERRIDTVRLLLQHKANYTLKNDFGDDALQTAALRGYGDIVETILEMTQLTVSDAIKAYELLGTNFVDEQNDMDAAVQIWRKAMVLRYVNKSAPLKKQLPMTQSVYLHLKEPENMEELNDLIDPEEIYMNTLMIRERILGPAHKDTTFGLMYRGAVYADSHRYQHCVDLWKYAYKLRNQASELFNPECLFTVQALVKLFWEIQVEVETMPVNAPVGLSITDVLDVLNILSEQIINGHNVHKMRTDILQTESSSCLQMLLQLFLHLIHLISRLESFDTQKHTYMNIIHKIIVQDPRGTDGESLLHLAVDPKISLTSNEFYSSFPSLDVIKILLSCGANVDSLKNNGNSPVYDCIKFFNMFHPEEQTNILNYLVSKGAHVDICNCDGESALTLIEKMALPFSTMNHLVIKDFFPWGFIKDLAYNTWVTDIDDLKAKITAAIERIDVEMLLCTWQHLEYRLDVLRITNGAHIKCL